MESNTLDDVYKQQRLTDLQSITNWYPHKFSVSRTIAEYRNLYDYLKNDEVLLDKIENIAGRIQFIRTSGSKLYFAVLESNEITVQILANANYRDDKETFILEKKILRRGDIVGVIGYPTRSTKGELSILPKQVILLAPCLRQIPKDISGLADVDSRFNQRYLDMIMHHDVRKIFRTRAGVLKFFRNYLDANNFIEVETPIISTKLGGANAKPFITFHNDIGKEMYMRVAPELFLKQLVIGGLERVYELGKQFRNEGIDLTHNPEFTSIEIYQAYADYNDMMQMTEKMFSELVLSVTGSYVIKYDVVDYENNTSKTVEIDFTPPFKRLDLINDLQKIAGFTFPPEIVSNLGSDEAREFLVKLCEEKNIKCPDPKTTPRLLDKLVGEYLEPLCHNPTFITNHPQIMSPLAKYHRENNNLTERFELFIIGKEYANAYTELNDPRTQKQCFENQSKDKTMGDGEAMVNDQDFVVALEYGLPPTAGLGIGIDRLVMLLTNQSAIREVNTFRS